VKSVASGHERGNVSALFVVMDNRGRRERAMQKSEIRHCSDWNVVVTVHEGGSRAARKLLSRWGNVAATDFHNVLVMRVDDPGQFARELAVQAEEDPGVMASLSHVVPATHTFGFQNAGEFEEAARRIALLFAPELAGRRFHVRMHRRGFKLRISSKDEEQRLDRAVLEAQKIAGESGTITFEDPDYILAIETVGQRAGASLWSRDELKRYPFLGLD
jgi:tRNA(Ser,Leu) C12 N-acetylase TAN1